MCIGLPMQVKESGFGYARCEGMGQEREVDTLLVGEQPPGTWLLVFLNSAREVINEETAEQISSALQALDIVMGSKDNTTTQDPLQSHHLDHLFADLIDREPPKPDSLLALEASRTAASSTTNNASVDDALTED